jgi:hypothetical protein
MNDSILKNIEEEILASFEVDELKRMNFSEFWAEIDVMNGYEEDWNPETWKDKFEIVFNKLVN